MDNSIFWVDVEKIQPNPYQPRREFDEGKLRELADSIRQYGILQPLTVTRRERETPDGGLATEYELIAGERRLRASKAAGVSQVPVIIRAGTEEENNRIKLELALIENIQREDLSAIDRARAFKQLAEEFNFRHHEIAKRVGKSREYVSNSVRLLALPEDILTALGDGRISEGHARPLLMLSGKPEERDTLFKDILLRRLSVREAERVARHTATERVRRWSAELEPDMLALERRLTDDLGTRVQIERREKGGRVLISFFSDEDLRAMLERLRNLRMQDMAENQDSVVHDATEETQNDFSVGEVQGGQEESGPQDQSDRLQGDFTESDDGSLAEDTVSDVSDGSEDILRNESPKNEDDGDLYSIKNFTI